MNRKFSFATNEFYHIYNRGVDKRLIFSNPRDYERFLFLLGVCNDTQPFLNSTFHYRGLTSIVKYFKDKERNPIVDVLCFCLMPNHFHLILRQREENGISKFIQKVSTGYSMYFNNRNERTGALFQGAFKAIHIDKDEYLKHLTLYLHLNPLEINKNNFNAVKNYPWSSLGCYLGIRKFPLILDDFLIKRLRKGYEAQLLSWISVKDKRKIFISEYGLEL